MPEEPNVLSQILGWAVPLGIIVFFAFKLYSGQIKILVDKFIDWIKDQGNKPKGPPSQFDTEYISRGRF